MSYNYYTLVDYPVEGKTFGKFKGRYPSQAAKKIINNLAKKNNIHNNTSSNTQLIVIIIKYLKQ